MAVDLADDNTRAPLVARLLRLPAGRLVAWAQGRADLNELAAKLGEAEGNPHKQTEIAARWLHYRPDMSILLADLEGTSTLTPAARLGDLLEDLFEEPELRGWLKRFEWGKDVERDLDSPASRRQTAQDAAEKLVARGHAGPEFFRELISSRDRRTADIEAVAVSLAEAPAPTAAPSPASDDPLVEVLLGFEDTGALARFLLRNVADAAQAEAIAEALPRTAPLSESAPAAVALLRRRGQITPSLLSALEQKLPGKVPAIRRMAPSGPARDHTSLGQAPLPETTINLDRIHQWMDVTDRSRSERHELFLLHGPPNQFLEDFTARVFRHLNESCRVSHKVHVVSADHDGYERPHTPAIWETRFTTAMVSGGGHTAVSALREAALREPAFVIFGATPFTRLTPPDEVRALVSFLSARLGPIVGQAAPAHPIRVYLSVEGLADDPLVTGAQDALTALKGEIKARYTRTPALSYPPWEDVVMYVDSLELEPPPPQEWWGRLRATWELHRDAGGHFRDLCRDLDRLLRERPPRPRRPR